MWNRIDVDFVQAQQLPWTVVPPGGFCQGEFERLLSYDPDDGARTSILRLRNTHEQTLEGGADVFVLEGDGRLGEHPMKPGHYFHIPQGSEVELVPGPARTTLYVGSFGEPLADADSDATVEHLYLEDVPWSQAEWSEGEDLEPGVFVKWLHRDAARGEVFVTSMLPGWKSADEEVHPTYEESFRLYGDLLQGARGLMTEGAYSFRSPGVWHAPLYTRGGTTSLIRSSAPSTTEFRDTPPGAGWEELVEKAYRDFKPDFA